MKIRRTTADQFSWERNVHTDTAERQRVQQLVREVQVEGDAALRRLTASFDDERANAEGWTPRVPVDELEKAWHALDADLQQALTRAAERIRHFHAYQKPNDLDIVDGDGARLGQAWRPISRVGVYAPGGRAAYPSTVLMNVIPAQEAGVPSITLCSPPQRDTGLPHPLVLAAAHLVGVHDVYRVGGAQAIAGLAYGTETLPRVDKVVGPGNLYVALAKREVMGDVGIDSIAGPSEVFVVADGSANVSCIAADMLAQAEHDEQAGAVCVLVGATDVADAVEDELQRQLAALPRRAIAERALETWGAIVTATDKDDALRIVNESAPEHLELLVEDPEDWLSGVMTAGAVFCGSYTPEPVGDYYAGSNHVLPTHGTARFASGLGVLDFMRRFTYVAYEQETLQRHADDIIRLATAEGLEGHARAVAVRQQTTQRGGR